MRTHWKVPGLVDWSPWSAEQMDNDRDNDVNLWSAHVKAGQTAQRTVHSTSACDEKVVICERKCNKDHTKSLAQNNLNIDVWQTIEGTVSMRTLRARPHAEEVLSEYCSFDPNSH